jgi:phosphoglucosamine mutase
MSRKYFGTDGIRGRVGAGPINPEFVLKLGWAVGKVFSENKTSKGSIGKVLIGKDTRISGYMFESALEAGLVAAGVDVALMGPMPTPAIAYLTRTFNARAGIVISASHNPYHDNGIKFFSGAGSKLPDDIEHLIEKQLDQPMTTVESNRLGKVTRIEDAAGRYIEFCKSTVPSGFTLDGMKIVIDCAHGATYHVGPAVLEELGAKVVTIGTKPDGLNINEGVGSTNPKALQEAVLEERADLGIALDGDGDRVLFVDHAGDVLDGDELLYIIACDQLRTTGQCRGVVGTLMSNLGFELALEELNIPFARAKVGDRYVIEQMQARDWQLGGESSGHVICADVTTTGDGMVAALKVLFACVATQKSLRELRQGMSKFPQTMINVAVESKFDLDALPQLQEVIADVENTLGERGRVLLRPSGTEPVVRVMVEGENERQVNDLAAELADAVARSVA